MENREVVSAPNVAWLLRKKIPPSKAHTAHAMFIMATSGWVRLPSFPIFLTWLDWGDKQDESVGVFEESVNAEERGDVGSLTGDVGVPEKSADPAEPQKAQDARDETEGFDASEEADDPTDSSYQNRNPRPPDLAVDCFEQNLARWRAGQMVLAKQDPQP
jgi:hypothetical protein